MITKETVEHIAKLASLNIPPDKLDLLTDRFAKVLEYVGQLNEVETSGVEPTTHALDTKWAPRNDEAAGFDAVDQILTQAPEKEEGFFKVPRVI